MLRRLRDTNAPLEMLAAARNIRCPHCDLMTRRTGAVRPVQVSRSKELGTLANWNCLDPHSTSEESIDELVENCVAAKVRRQTFDGYSPLQWWFGTQCAREVEEQGLGENRSSFERRLQFQTSAQTAFVRADARKTLRMAENARSRELRNPTVGQLVRCLVAVMIVVLVERWFSLVLQENLQLNSQRRCSHKSQQLCGWRMEVP